MAFPRRPLATGRGGGCEHSGGAEDRYNVVIHSPDGTTVAGKNLAYPGDCLLIHQAGDGSVTVSNVGSIAAPEAATVKKNKK